jgi:hypothetical protein
VPRAGHLVIEERQDILVREIKEFFNSEFFNSDFLNSDVFNS